MAVTNPVKVKQPSIVSSDLISFDEGLDERGDYNAAPNAYTYGRNVRVNSSGNVVKRLSKRRWLPDAVGYNSEVGSVYIDGELYHFIADDSEVKFCQENDTAWTSCGGSNSITTTDGVITTFMRTNNALLCMNGVDVLRYIDLESPTFDMVVFTAVVDPVSTLTATATGLTASGSYNVYYGITYNSDGGGETATGPILTQAVSKSRSTWASDGSEYLTISFNDTPPAGATSRNIYAAVALQGTTPQASDLFMLRSNIPLGDSDFDDNGSVPFDISFNSAPSENSTQGIKAAKGELVNNIPVLYDDPDNPYTLYFGGVVETGVSFGSNNGGQRLPLMEGTNFYPSSVIGFRNNQGVPSLLALFTSVDGISKQQTVSHKTITYGNITINYWGADELNTAASAVYSKYGVINYLGQLIFPSSDGFTSIKTEAQLQNVLQPSLISKQISPSYATIKNAAFEKIVGTAWNDQVLFAVPSRGYNYNNQIFVYDLSNKDKPKWSIWDIEADWIGTLSPPDRSSFVYGRKGTSIFKLIEGYAAEDEDSTGLSTAFPVVVDTTLKAFSRGRNSYFATNQVVVYIANWIGTITIRVTYINNKGKVKTKSKTFTNGSFSKNFLAGWSNPRLLYRSSNNRMTNWSTPMVMSSESNNSQKDTKRLRIKLPNPVINEAKIRVSSDLSNTSFDLVNANFEGINIGIIGDIV